MGRTASVLAPDLAARSGAKASALAARRARDNAKRPGGKQKKPAQNVERTRRPGRRDLPPGVIIRAYKPRNTKVNLTPELLAAVTRAKTLGIKKDLVPFEFVAFESFEDFDEEWGKYCRANFACYRRRHSHSREAFNRTLTVPVVLAGEESNEGETIELDGNSVRLRPGVKIADLLPPTMSFQVATYRCTHGCTQKSRSTGERVHNKTRYNGCQARITAEAQRVGPDQWVVIVHQEVTEHNHRLNARLYDMYLNSSEIVDDDLYAELEVMIQANGNTKSICDIVSARLGRTFTRQQLDNFKRYRLGGCSAQEGLEFLLHRFSTFEGSNCLVVSDQHKEACAFVLQSAVQREMFQRWGDTLILDWTHNTNNLGFYLGSLVATSPTGKGVSVLDFLCVAQTKDMMRVVLQHFVDTNPGARDSVKSFIIDKDYNEWDVLREVFPRSTVLLCQFHVLKWFKYVLTVPKYNIPVDRREEVMKILRGLVYAGSDADYEQQQAVLDGVMSAAEHELFRDYMADRWYSCHEMWSNCRRGLVFTAANTTSNRIESNWNQLKQLLGKKTRIDKCVEAIFTHTTVVLRREEKLIREYATKTQLHAGIDPFISPAMREVSAFASQRIRRQWQSYSCGRGHYIHLDSHESIHTLVVSLGSPRQYSVNSIDWSCTCRAYASTWLPCRHLMFVSRDILKQTAFPILAIPPRWRLDLAESLLESLEANIGNLSTLRLSEMTHAEPTPDILNPGDGSDEDDSEDTASGDQQARRSVVYIRLQRREVGNAVVLSNLEKRNILQTEFEEVESFLVRLGTSRFTPYAVEWSDMLHGLLKKWRGEERAHADTRLRATQADMTSDAVASAGPKANAVVAPTVDPYTDEDDARDAAAEASNKDANEAENGAYALEEDELELEDEVDEDREDEQAIRASQDAGPSRAVPSVSQTVAGNAVEYELDAWDHPITMLPSLYAVPYAASCPGKVLRDAVVSAGPPASEEQRGAAGEDGDSDVAELDLSFDYEGDYVEANDLVHDGSDGFVEIKRELPPVAKRHLAGVVPDTPMTVHISIPTPADVQLPPRATGGWDTLSIRLPVSSGTPRIARQQSNVAGRLVALNQDSACPVFIDNFVEAVRHLRCLDTALNVAHQYPVLMDEPCLRNRRATVKKQRANSSFRFNFAVPPWVVAILQSAINEHKTDNQTTVSNGCVVDVSRDTSNTCEQYVASFPGIRGFSQDTLHDMQRFHDLHKALDRYKVLKQWLTTKALWAVPSCCDTVAFLQQEVSGVEGLHNSLGTEKVRAAVESVLDSCSLTTRISVIVNNTGIMAAPVESIVGRIAFKEQLSDSVVNLALGLLCSEYNDVYLVDSLLVTSWTEQLKQRKRARTESDSPPLPHTRNPQVGGKVPAASLTSMRLVVFPVNFVRHWCIILVSMVDGKGRAFLYDPLSPNYHPELQKAWESSCLPWLQRWSERDGARLHQDAIPVQYVSTPRQAATDGHSCGVYCVIQGWNYATDKYELHETPTLSAFQLKHIRLRLLWLILTRGTVQSSSTNSEAMGKSLSIFGAYYTAIGRTSANSSSAIKKKAKSRTKA